MAEIGVTKGQTRKFSSINIARLENFLHSFIAKAATCWGVAPFL